MKLILDVSHHQVPSKMDYDVLAKQIDLVIIRTQYGSNLIDRHYKKHHEEFQKRGIPTAAYAWVRGVSENDMKVEARDFYNRTKQFQPTFWFVDVEEKSMANMRAGISAYIKELRRLGAEKVGIYVGHHLYKSFNLKMEEADAVWLPHYGKNNGTVNSTPKFPCDFHQYTDKGRLKGYNGPLDLNRFLSDKPWSYFVHKRSGQPTTKQFAVTRNVGAYRTAKQAKEKKQRVGTVQSGTYFIFNERNGMVNVTKQKGIPGSWIDPAEMRNTKQYYTVKRGDTLSHIAAKNGLTVSQIHALNPQIKNVNIIYANEKVRIK